MDFTHFRVYLMLLLSFLNIFILTTKSQSCSVIGVNPKDCSKYTTNSKIFECGGKDNKRIPMKYVNDDYCDCPETGLDEPGTSACMKSTFYCQNKGFRGQVIFSSWVNDGLCDCCDGSDEWLTQKERGIKCPNTCHESAQEELKEVKIQKEIYKQGLQAKSQLMGQAGHKIAEKKRQILELQTKITDLETRTEIAKIKKESFEEKEQKYRDELKAKQEAKREKEQQEQQSDQQTDDTQQQTVAPQSEQQSDNTQTQSQSDSNTQQQSQPESETREQKDDGLDEEFPYPDEYRPPDDQQQKQPELDEEFPYPEEYRYHGDDEEQPKTDDDGFDWSEFEDGEEEEIFPEYDEPNVEEDDIPYDPLLDDISHAANDARNDWKNLDRELRDLRRELGDIEGFEEIDFGPNNEYASLYDECYSKTLNKYTYEFCPFISAIQKEKSHSDIKMGKFNKFDYSGENNENKIIMYFDKGQSCWKGPQRSVKVIFECDSKNEIQSVSEPSTCTYDMIFKTPLACKQQDIEKFNYIINNQFKQEL